MPPHNPMTYRGKYFVTPSRDGLNFKELFTRLATTGAGRPVNADGVPNGAWTAESLSKAINELSGERELVDTRTVQLWFQDNEKGISAENIHHLARIFGCDDPQAVGAWQAELSAANRRLTIERREKRATKVVLGDNPRPDPMKSTLRASLEHAQVMSPRSWLARVVDSMFSDRGSLNLPITIWSGSAALWFMTFLAGVHSVTYSPLPGIVKEVGYFWAVSWNIGELLVLPVFLLMVVRQVHFWKNIGRPQLNREEDAASWIGKLQSFNTSLCAIFLISAIMVFLVQWVGVYLLPLLGSGHESPMVDWALVAKYRSDVIGVPAAITISLYGFLFSGLMYWFYFNGLLLTYVIADDFNDSCSRRRVLSEPMTPDKVEGIAHRVIYGAFVAGLMGAVIAICLKLNAAYLVSDAASMSLWLMNDARQAISASGTGWTWLRGTPSPFFTSFLLIFITCFVSVASFVLVLIGSSRALGVAPAFRNIQLICGKMTLVLVTLTACYLAIGTFYGFSILLAAGLITSFASALIFHPPNAGNSSIPDEV